MGGGGYERHHHTHTTPYTLIHKLYGGQVMTGDSDSSLEGPPAPLPSRNASHTSLCSLDLSR